MILTFNTFVGVKYNAAIFAYKETGMTDYPHFPADENVLLAKFLQVTGFSINHKFKVIVAEGIDAVAIITLGLVLAPGGGQAAGALAGAGVV